MGMNVGGSGAYNADINVTPLVDIMLVILIIFMVVTPLLGSNVAVTLPKGKNPIKEQKINSDKAVVISVPLNKIWYLGRDQVQAAGEDETLASLTDKISKKIEKLKPEDRVVYIKASQDVQYQYVVKTIDAVRNAGIDRIGLVVDPEKGGTALGAGGE